MDDPKGLDFEELRRLAESDPEAFEERRKSMIDAAINRAPTASRNRLRALQWRVEQERRRCRTPLAACISLSGMMWDAVTGEHGLLEAMQGRPPQRAGRKAKVLAFPHHRAD